jgi:hypothetical protein
VEAVHPRGNETDADTSVIAGATQDNSEKWVHLEWQYLVIATKFYCVFIDKELDIDWSTTPEREARGADDPAQYHQIMDEVSALETAPCDGLGNDVKLHYKRLIGEAISRNFEDQYESARRMLATAEAYYRARSGETSRRWYLIASFKAVAPIVLAGGLLWLGRPFAMALVGPGAFKVLIAAVAGALGALLSVITRSGRLTFDCSAGRSLHDLEGASRICAGMLSGVLVGLAIQSGLLLGPLVGGGNQATILLLAAFVAGTTERFAPSIISKLAPHFGGYPRTETSKDSSTDADDSASGETHLPPRRTQPTLLVPAPGGNPRRAKRPSSKSPSQASKSQT